MNAVPRRSGFSAALLVAALAAAACGGDSTGTQAADPGLVTVSLVTPNTDDGAVLLSLSGTSVSDLQSASGSYRVYWRLAAPGEVRAVVVGNIAAGPIFTATVPDRRALGQVTAAVAEVASRSDVLRASVSGYQLSIAAGP